ncbi:MAG: hypothetical protein NVV68_12025 [Dokdonella sp.]|nr:hypothetical protein [Dokdonella sp.]
MRGEQAAQAFAERAAPIGVEPRPAGLARHDHAAELRTRAGQHDDAHRGDGLVGGQHALDRVERDALLLDLGDAVAAAAQHEAAGGRCGTVGARLPVASGQMRRAHPQRVVLDTDLDVRQRPPRGIAVAVAPAPGDAAGLGAAVDLDRRMAEQRTAIGQRLVRQRTARREHAVQSCPCRRPRQRLRQPLQMRGAGDQQRRAARERGGDVLRKRQACGRERAPGRERPQHAEQQAVDVLVRDRRMHAGLRRQVRPGAFERADLVEQLAEPLADRRRLATRSGRVDGQAGPVRIERAPVGRGRLRRRPQRIERGRHVAREALDVRAEPGQRRRQGVGRQPDLGAGMPGAEQRRRELESVLDIQADRSDARLHERPAARRRGGAANAPNVSAVPPRSATA